MWGARSVTWLGLAGVLFAGNPAVTQASRQVPRLPDGRTSQRCNVALVASVPPAATLDDSLEPAGPVRDHRRLAWGFARRETAYRPLHAPIVSRNLSSGVTPRKIPAHAADDVPAH